MTNTQPGTLYIVPSPIGNLEDITYRAIKILSTVDLILCEDTRKTKILCNRYNIHTPLKSYHLYNELVQTKKILPYILKGHNVALVTNSGTPGISDPGFIIVRECINHGVKIVPLPGPTAFVTALSGSGLPMTKILFLGFIPKKKEKIKKLFSEINIEKTTIVFYESPKRLLATLNLLSSLLPQNTQCAISFELTKIFERYLRGTISEVINQIENSDIKGELVVMLYVPK